MRLRLLLTASALAAGGFACASIVGLDHSDLPATAVGGGTILGDGSVTTDQGITITPTQVALNASCGETKLGTFNIINNGANDRPYAVDVPPNDIFTLDATDGGAPASGTVKAHDVVKITLKARSDAPGSQSLDIIVKAGDSVQSVNLKSAVSGATLSIDPQIANFGQVRQNQTSEPITAVFTNNGNAPVTIASFGGLDTTQFQINPAGTIVVEGGKTASAQITMLGAPADASQIVELLTPQLQAGSTLCAQAAPQLTLEGQRVSTNVIVSPLTADFGSNDCNTTPSTTKVIDLTNYDPQNPVPYSFTIGGTAFSVADSGNLVIPKATSASVPGKSTLTISANGTGATPGPVATTLSVTVNPADTGPKTYAIPVTMTVTGAVLNWDVSQLMFTQNGQRSYAHLQNSGNATACVLLESTDSHFGVTTFTTVSGGSSSNVSVTFRPSYCKTNYSGNIVIQQGDCLVARSAPICNPPPTLAVSGRDNCNGP